MFLFCLVFAMFCARLFICALWSPAGKGLTSWLSFVVSSVSLSLSHWYPGSGVVLDCIDYWSLHHYLLWFPDYYSYWARTIVHKQRRSESIHSVCFGVKYWLMSFFKLCFNVLFYYYRHHIILLVSLLLSILLLSQLMIGLNEFMHGSFFMPQKIRVRR